jgi:hypothetical protein
MYSRIGVFLLNMYKASKGTVGEAGMKHSYARTNIFAFLAISALSALTMIWLFWHYPLKTLFATIAVLAALGVSARLARSVESDSGADLDQREQRI